MAPVHRILTVVGLVIIAVDAFGSSLQEARIDEATQVLQAGLAMIEVNAKADAVHLAERTNWKSTPNSQNAERTVAHVRVSKRSTSAPNGIARDSTSYDWCDCRSGLRSVTIWPGSDHQLNQSIVVGTNSSVWLQWSVAVEKISWFCDGMQKDIQTAHVKLAAEQWLSLHVTAEKKDTPFSILPGCFEPTGRLAWNKWVETNYTTSVPFTSNTEGYNCFKIPALLRTVAGALIAFTEARRPGCSDYSNTDLVYKRSVDGGKTWGALSTLVNVSPEERLNLGLCGHPLVIGNVAPLQLARDSRYPGRILAPHNRNNFETWLTHSDDDGKTWSPARKLENVGGSEKPPDCNRNMTYFGFDIDVLSPKHLKDVAKFISFICDRGKDPFKNPDWVKKLTGPWQWVGVGPPGGLQLKNGRVIIPCYHSYLRGLEGKGVLPISQLYNNFGKGHLMISDDFGDTWRLGSEWPLGQGADENQLALLSNGSILTNSRSFSTGSPQWRLQARSEDGGETFTGTSEISIPQPFGGCQGSTVSASNPESSRGSDTVFVASPDPISKNSIVQKIVDSFGCSANLTGRERVTIWRSTDGGTSYPEKLLIDPGLSAQTSLQYHNGKLLLLYEQADPQPFNPSTAASKALLANLAVLHPTRIVYREVTSFDKAMSDILI
jgi:sialidase-1